MIITGGTVFIVVSVSMLNKLRFGVLGVAKLLMTVFMCMLCVLRGVRARTSVCEYDIRVFAYNYILLILIYMYIFFAFLYPRNLLLGHITKPYSAPVTQ